MNEEELKVFFKNDKRIYYHDIYGKIEPNYESMAAYLLDEGVLFLSSAINKDDVKECMGLFININDYFCPASDSEAVTYDELPTLFRLYLQKKHDGVAQFVADKRGIPNVCWRESKSIEFNPEQLKKIVTEHTNSLRK